jgi:hypothetical protein
MINADTSRANGSALAAWGLWLMANIAGINEVLQSIALLCAIVASVVSVHYHIKRARKNGG